MGGGRDEGGGSEVEGKEWTEGGNRKNGGRSYYLCLKIIAWNELNILF